MVPEKGTPWTSPSLTDTPCEDCPLFGASVKLGEVQSDPIYLPRLYSRVAKGLVSLNYIYSMYCLCRVATGFNIGDGDEVCMGAFMVD